MSKKCKIRKHDFVWYLGEVCEVVFADTGYLIIWNGHDPFVSVNVSDVDLIDG